MTSLAADRGGPFGRSGVPARNWMRAAPPGIAPRCRPVESSPIGSAVAIVVQPSSRWRGQRAWWSAGLIAMLLIAAAACFGNALYIVAKAQLAQVLLHAAWSRTQASGVPAKPWPWADTFPVARLVAPSLEQDVLPGLVGQAAVRAHTVSGQFIDIGVPADYYRFCEQHGG